MTSIGHFTYTNLHMYFFMTFFASLVALSDTSSILCALRHLLSRKSKRVVRLNQTEYIVPVVQPNRFDQIRRTVRE
jgi:hypothetical protein